MKKKQTKRAVSFLMLVTMLVSLLSPMTAAAETAAKTTPILQYLTEEEQTVTNGGNHLDASGDLEQVKDLDAFTLTMEFKTSSNGLQSIFFVGSNESGTQDKHFNLYLNNNNTVGIEIRDASQNPAIKATVPAYAGTDYHKLTLTYLKDQYYKLYLDGKLALNHTTAADVARFLNSLGMTPNTMTFGMGTRVSGNNYPFTGSLRNIKIYDQALSEEEILADHAGEAREDIVYQYNNGYFTEGTSYAADTAEEVVNALKTLDEGSVAVRYRAESADNGRMTLFSLSNNADAATYLSLYVIPNENKAGFDFKGDQGMTWNHPDWSGTHNDMDIHNTEWHTVTFTKAKDTDSKKYHLYVDAVEIGAFSNQSTFLNAFPTANAVGIGFTDRADGQPEWNFKGAIDHVTVYSSVLSAAEVTEEYNKTKVEAEIVEVLGDTVKTEPESLFYGGYDGSRAYRIPSMITTQEGTVIAGIDKRQSGLMDQGNIDMVVRRKENAKEADSAFGEPIVVADMNNNGGEKPAFLIDSELVQDTRSGRIYMLYDMNPECAGLMESALVNYGSGHEEIDGKDYKMLYTDGRDLTTKFGTIREDGVVYDKDGNKTDYVVVTECQAPYTELGNLYKNGEYVGNIYRYTGPDKGELSVLRTQYLWLSHSDDDGKTWSVPKDITAQVKPDNVIFLGPGPGAGIQLKDGTLVFAVYSGTENLQPTQSSALITSEDGENWVLKESPNKDHNVNADQQILTESQMVQTPNGDIHLFMRTGNKNIYESVTSDKGNTWTPAVPVSEIPDAGWNGCQLTVTSYMKGDKMYVVLVNPAAERTDLPARNTGKLYLGEVSSEDNTTITWIDSKYINHQRYAYSCITVIENDGVNPKFGLIYEDETNAAKVIDLYYTEFDEAWIKNKQTETIIPNPKLVSKEVTLDGAALNIEMTFDQKVLATGSPLTLTVGDQTFTADYVSGSATDTLTFTGIVPDGAKGLVKVSEIGSAGYFENAVNGQPEIAGEVLYDPTKITGVTVSDYSTQHSNSTQENVDGAASNVVDGNPNTYWHSNWSSGNTLPQYVTVDLGSVKNIYKLSYLPRQNQSSGRVKDYEIFGSTNGTDFTPITEGTFSTGVDEQFAEFAPTEVQYIKFVVNTSTVSGSCSVAELGFFEYADGVIEAGNKATLQMLADSVKDFKAADYSAASWGAFENAKTKAESLLLSEIASQSKLDDAYAALLGAKRALVELKWADAVKAQYNALVEKDYTAESWAAFTTAVADADTTFSVANVRKDLLDSIMKVSYEMSKLQRELKTYTAYVDGKVHATGDYNKRVDLHAEAAKDGKDFVCWMASSTAEGEKAVVSVKPDYTFYLANDVYLTAVYEKTTIEPAATLINTIAIPAADGKVNARFVGQLTVPEGAVLKRAGLVWSTKDTPENLQNINAAGAKVTDVNSVNNAYQFSVTINGMPKGKFVRGVIFAEIQLEDGTIGNICYSVEGTITN